MDKKCKNFKKNQKQEFNMKKPIDLSQCLPAELHDRVSKIINVPCGKCDPFEDRKKLTFKDLLTELDPNLVKKFDYGVSDENFADIVEKYQQHRSFEVKIEPRIPTRKLSQQDINWIAEYSKKMKKERIVWQTKLFKDNLEIYEKPLFDQTEELIGIAAEHFAIWLKQMDDESNINKEFVKQLFSIEVESDASKALYVDAKEISVIPHEVSKMLNLPKLSVQNSVIKMSRKDKKLRDQQPRTVAFGRILPKSMQSNKFNEDLFDELYTINCPPDLCCLKTVFQSILHLRSTQALEEHLKANPDLPRAKYLADNNMFDYKSSLKIQKQPTPLWTHFY